MKRHADRLVNKCLAAMFLVLVLPATCAAAELRGTVKSKATGRPLAGVEVFSRCRRVDTTDAEGRFKLADPYPGTDCGRVVFFWGTNVLPLIKIIEASASELHVVLEETKGDEYQMPYCPAKPDGWKRVGWFMQLPLPKGTSVKSGGYTHGMYYDVRLVRWEGRPPIKAIAGGYIFAYPQDDWILKAEEFSLRLLRVGEKYLALDTRGRAPDGTLWRYVGTFGESFYYVGVNEQTARSLDRLFDGVCYRPDAPR